MPVNNPSPNFALHAAFNARTWSGVNVFNRGLINITLPTFSTGEGIFEDAISFLNGRGKDSGFSTSDLLQAGSAFGSNWSVTINENDKVVISCDNSFKIKIKSGDDILGVQLTSYGTASTSYTCPLDWTRGNGVNLGTISFVDSSDANEFTFTMNAGMKAQDVIVCIRERGTTNDIDDVNTTNCIEELDSTANSNQYISWYVNDSGHVECMYYNTVGDISWVSTTFRDRLGFSGNETPSGSTVKTLTADYPLPGSLYPTRPYQDHHMITNTNTQARRKIGGGYVSNFIGSYVSSVLSFDLDALLDTKDLYRHFTNNFIQYIPPGERINFYQNVGDSRRSLITSGITASQPAYDLLYTSEDNGNTGRIRASIINSESVNLVYPNRLKRRVPVSLTMEHL